jgi:hypothetical protein
MWSFGDHTQRLTDAVNFRNEVGHSTSIRLTGATEARTHVVRDGEQEDLWIFSAAAMDTRGSSPTRIAHSGLVFDYLVDAKVVLAECPDATGRTIPDTQVPFADSFSASTGIVAARTSPPDTWLCWMAMFGLGARG